MVPLVIHHNLFLWCSTISGTLSQRHIGISRVLCTFARGLHILCTSLHLFAPLCTSLHLFAPLVQSKAKQSKAKDGQVPFDHHVGLSLVFVLQNIPAVADFISTLTDSTGTPIGLAGVCAIVFGCIPIPGRPITLGHQTIFVTVTGQLCRLPLTLFVSNTYCNATM